MKNSIYTAVLLLSMGIALMACERDSTDEIITHNTTPNWKPKANTRACGHVPFKATP
jgi:hypothetical protein